MYNEMYYSIWGNLKEQTIATDMQIIMYFIFIPMKVENVNKYFKNIVI